MGFRLAPRSMTLDDLELHKFEFSANFSGFWRISDAIAVKRMKIDQYCQRQRCRHVELEQFWQAFASRGFVSDSWAFLLFWGIKHKISRGTRHYEIWASAGDNTLRNFCHRTNDVTNSAETRARIASESSGVNTDVTQEFNQRPPSQRHHRVNPYQRRDALSPETGPLVHSGDISYTMFSRLLL